MVGAVEHLMSYGSCFSGWCLRRSRGLRVVADVVRATGRYWRAAWSSTNSVPRMNWDSPHYVPVGDMRALKRDYLTGPNPVGRDNYNSKIHLITERTHTGRRSSGSRFSGANLHEGQALIPKCSRDVCDASLSLSTAVTPHGQFLAVRRGLFKLRRSANFQLNFTDLAMVNRAPFQVRC